MKPFIGFAGMGHLGTHSKAAAFKKGFKVVGYDLNTACCVDDLRECDIVYISPDRPGPISPQQMVDLVLPVLKPDAVLVILCQVDLGFTRKINWPSHLLYYQVETLKVNDEAMERALHPERIIIGQALMPIEHKFLHFLESFNCRIIPMAYESAELAKMAINLYLVSQLETTNRLAKVAEKIGVDWNAIIPALQTDKRIGQYAYLKPGNGIGPHLQRDVDAIKEIYDSIS